MRHSVLHFSIATVVGVALALSCSKDDPVPSTGAAGPADAGLSGNAQPDASMGSSAGAAGEASVGAGHCALPNQVQNATTGFCDCPPRLPDACPDACVDLLHDAEHCGDCDTACEPGAGCRAGVCAVPPTEVATLEGCVNPRMILSDGVLYFSDTGSGKISSMPIAGDAATATEIASGQMMENPQRPMWTSAIALDADAIYWSNMGDNTLMKAPLSGGAPAVLISLDAPSRGLAVGNGSVFFTHHADLFKISSSGLAEDAGAGTPPAALDCGDAGLTPQLGEPVAGASYVASSNESCIPNGQAAAIAINETDVIYTIDVHGALSQNSQNGGAHASLILGDDVGPAREVIVLNATHAFAAGYSSVLKAQLGEAAVYEAVVYAVDAGIVTGFTVTETHVYLASDRGGISRASITPPTDNSLPVSEHLVRDQEHPRWLLNDGTHLYWITSDCRIMSIPMPP